MIHLFGLNIEEGDLFCVRDEFSWSKLENFWELSAWELCAMKVLGMFGSLLANCLDKACCLAETFGIFSTSEWEVIVVCLLATSMEDKLLVVELSLYNEFQTETPCPS